MRELAAADPAKLAALLAAPRLVFGTAGLRGAMHAVGAGHMNAVTVRRHAEDSERIAPQ